MIIVDLDKVEKRFVSGSAFIVLVLVGVSIAAIAYWEPWLVLTILAMPLMFPLGYLVGWALEKWFGITL